MKASHIGAIVLVVSGLVSFAANAADAEAGKTKSAVCAACHGADVAHHAAPLVLQLYGERYADYRAEFVKEVDHA